jgi:ribonucleoside-diphosphate reductase beta chain
MSEFNVNEHFPEHIFNLNKKDYAYSPLFLGERMGLIDTIHKPHKPIEDMAFRLKNLDWSETEFPCDSCKIDFQQCDRSERDGMLYTLATQWEADTEAARHVVPILAPVITSTELWTYYGEELRNENLHARVYSNIVRSSFDDPEEGMKEILTRIPALKRISVVTDVFAETYDMTAEYGLRRRPNDMHLYKQVFKMVIAKYILERLQFISSFGVSFCITYTGRFNPIGKNLEKICQDELEIHSRVGELIFDIEMRTDRGLLAFNQLRLWIVDFLRKVVQAELDWVDFIHEEGRRIPNATPRQLKDLVLMNAAVVYKSLSIPIDFDYPKRHPIPLIESSFNISKSQNSAQEEKGGQYMLGGLVRDLSPGPMKLAFAKNNLMV